MTDDQAILLSDIFPTGYFGADMAEIKPGDTVCVFGCGPVGLFAIVERQAPGRRPGLRRRHAARPAGEGPRAGRGDDRLQRRAPGRDDQGADAAGSASTAGDRRRGRGRLTGRPTPSAGDEAFAARREQDAPEQRSRRAAQWLPGDAPSQVLTWAVQALAKAGTLSIIGVYPETMTRFPIGMAMMKNLTLQMGNCPHRKYIPRPDRAGARPGAVDPTRCSPSSSDVDRRDRGVPELRHAPARLAQNRPGRRLGAHMSSNGRPHEEQVRIFLRPIGSGVAARLLRVCDRDAAAGVAGARLDPGGRAEGCRHER